MVFRWREVFCEVSDGRTDNKRKTENRFFFHILFLIKIIDKRMNEMVKQHKDCAVRAVVRTDLQADRQMYRFLM